MLKVISSLFDRCLFTVLFIFGVQIPEFIQQYSQRLSGHLNEALGQLNEYQLVADRHFDGSLPSMVTKYLTNSEPAIKETAAIINNVSNRVSDLKSQLFNIKETEYIESLYYFLIQFDSSMAQATLEQYQLAIPISLPALATGVLLALGVTLFMYLVVNLIKMIIASLFRTKPIKPLTKKINQTNKANKVEKEVKKEIKVIPRIGDINNI